MKPEPTPMSTSSNRRSRSNRDMNDARSTKGRRLPVVVGVVLALVLAVALVALARYSGGPSEADLVASAKTYLERQDAAAATIQLKTALQKNPNNAEARLLLGRSLLDGGDPVAAAIELRKALESGASADEVQPPLARAVLMQGDPAAVVREFGVLTLFDAEASAEVRTVVASAFATLGELDKAREATFEALKEWPGHISATLMHARLMAVEGDVPGALGLTEEALSREPTHLGALLLKGELQRFGLRDRTLALQTYAQAVDAHPRSATSHAAIVSMLMEQRDVDAARTRHQQMRTLHPNHPETRLFEAQFAFLDEDFARSRELTEQLLRFLPDDIRVLQLAGLSEMRLGNLPQAEAHFARIVAGRPDQLLPRHMLAQIYVRTGQPARVAQVLAPALAVPEPDSTSLTLAGEAALQSGELATAERYFAQAARTNPQATTARAALALSQVARGNTAAGFTELEAVASADPGIRSNLALVAARMRTNDIPGALRAIDELEQKQPDRPTADVLRGTIQMQRRETDAARASFQRALAKDPLFYPATAGLASLELAAGQPDAARRHFQALLQRDPRNHRALLGMAEIKARTGAPKDEVTAAVNEAVRQAPGELAPRVVLVNHLLAHRDFQAALTAAQAAHAALPAAAETLELLGNAQLAAGEQRQAIATLTRLAAARPDRPEPEMKLAEAHVAADDLASAKRSLNKALQIRPGHLPAQRALAQIAMREEQPQVALDIARAVQRAEPKQAAGFVLEAEIEAQRGRNDASIAALRKALQAAPSSELAIQLHRSLTALQRGSEADRVAADWLRERPRDIGFRFYLGDLALARNDLATSERHYRSVLQINPDHALAMNNVAWILTHDGKPEGLAMAQRANELLPEQPPIMDTLAWALGKAGQAREAVELQRRAIAKAPNEPSLKLTLAKIHIANGENALARTELEALARLGDGFRQQAEVSRLLATL
jgi:cellulose synthase operon protein C